MRNIVGRPEVTGSVREFPNGACYHYAILIEPVTSCRLPRLRMRNLGGVDKVTGSVRNFLLEPVAFSFSMMLLLRPAKGVTHA